jgi:hypothetical protein
MKRRVSGFSSRLLAAAGCGDSATVDVGGQAREYIETGKAKLVFRGRTRRFSREQRVSFIDLRFANQMNWIEDFDDNGMITRDALKQVIDPLAGG